MIWTSERFPLAPTTSRAMHYLVGQKVLNGDYCIHLIQCVDEEYRIWIERDDEVMLWKSFTPTVPVSVEYNINF